MKTTHSPAKRRLFWSAFLDGIGGCGLFETKPRQTRRNPPDDLQALRSDWLRIGDDFRGATLKARQKTPSGNA